jgi:hypothetical protein
MEVSMKTAYTFSVLRYVHDPVTAEFVNIGVALYAPAVKYLNAICTSHYRRLSVVFDPIDGDHFREITRFLESRQVIKYLRPKRIVAPDYDYEFTRARKNEVWHAYEPISFDLAETDSIKDKANRWLGRVTTLADSKEKFRLHLLLGSPRESKLQKAYVQAKNILNKMPGKPQFIEENDAEHFADALKKEIDEHGE